jgi:hypothetical protein
LRTASVAFTGVARLVTVKPPASRLLPRVLFVRVCVAVARTTVPVVFGRVIILS